MSIVITGARGGLGSEVASLLAADGARVIGIGIKDAEERPATLTDYYGGVDLADEGQAESTFKAISQSNGPISGLINIAGSFTWQSVEASTEETWRLMYRTNVLTALNASRAALPHFADPGVITFVGAAAATRAAEGMGPYTAAKSALARLSEALSEEVKARGIRVNLVCPTIIDTPANRNNMPDEDFDKWVTPGEVAQVIRFLSSPHASGVTGAEIRVSGRT